MPSRLVLKFRSQSEPVIAGALETAAEVTGSLAATYDVFLEEGEQKIDWTLLQKLISRRLASKSLRLAELDAGLEVGRSGDKELRRERNRLAALLRSELRAARFLLDESLGREVSAGLLRWREPSQVMPAGLVALARETATSLRSSAMLAEASLTATGAFPDPTGLAGALERRALELERQLQLLAPKLKRETFAVGEKSQEWQDANSARLRSQDLLFGLYRAAGKDHLAQRLRPKARMGAVKAEGAGAPGAAEEGGSRA
jgi:hypothetical protein